MTQPRMIAVVAAFAAALLVVTVSPTQAHHRRNIYCDQDPDLCLNARKVDAGRRFWIFRDGGSWRRYRLCVTAPDRSRTCHRFGMEEGLDFYTDSVMWREHFPHKGAGAYVVAWKRLNGDRIGPRLGFHVRG